MANTQTTVPIFVAAQVLEAAQLNQSAATGVPVFATTVTRDAGFGSAGEKVLAEGQLCYLESTNVVQYYDGAAWATVGPAPAVSSGLIFIASGTATSAASVALTNIFSATYTNYKLILSDITSTNDLADMYMQFGTSATADTAATYNSNGVAASSALANTRYNLATYNFVGRNMGTTNNYLDLEINSPNLASRTYFSSRFFSNRSAGAETVLMVGNKATNTQYTDIFFSLSSDNVGFKYQLYGYANS